MLPALPPPEYARPDVHDVLVLGFVGNNYVIDRSTHVTLDGTRVPLSAITEEHHLAEVSVAAKWAVKLAFTTKKEK